MPGFNDAHVHLLMGACSLHNLELTGEDTVDGIMRRIATFARTHTDRDWLLGRGWFYAVFPGGMPHPALLDQAVSDRPVAIEAYDSHTTWVNSAALARLGIGDDTAEPPGGGIQREAAGRASRGEVAVSRPTIAHARGWDRDLFLRRASDPERVDPAHYRGRPAPL
ncbi:MAG: hypothetical protein E6I60_01880 [Chloroflexi bacterium]|nr:MAG: hypothetical protein E6I60_01880 [Chloroflexota bacterium]